MDPKVDFYFDAGKKWHKETVLLRKIVLDCGLNETLKWGCPCYTFDSRNIVLIHVFKEYCALLFFKGALLNDAGNILIQQTENVQAARQMRFTGVTDISNVKAAIRQFVYEAIEIEKAGIKVPLKKTTAYKIPEEFKHKLVADAALKTAFEALTPGRQRGYMLYFSAPKQSATRVSRIEKSIPQIIAGKGLND